MDTTKEAGFTDVSAYARGNPLSSGNDKTPIEIPAKEHPSDGEKRNEREPAAKHAADYGSEKAAERDWTTGGKS